ncbi:HNH endonuclease [Paenarthrobacter sp. C1]|uniref:HNH endonuclease n=1 Tax=Paenarthrobacter sp. C1 TaxID=3400220 RepID=UPI003BF5F4BE
MTNPGAVALLNATNEPFGHIPFPQAVRMLFRGVAEVVVADTSRAPIGPHPWPKVMRLLRKVMETWLDRPAAWHRGGVFIRDRHRCAYCGAKATTIDHIVPRSRGGNWSYTNCVAACETCNFDKADRTPQEAGMVLKYAWPYVPTIAELRALARAER